MSTYPKADARTQWFGDDYAGSRMNPNCGCLHTTEGTGWPPYSGGATAPNLTGMPLMREKRIAWRQHYSDEVSARALQNDAGGVETNTANVIQVELIGTCDPGTRGRWKRAGLTPGVDFIYWPDAPEWALRQVAELIADYHRRHGIKIQGPDVWKAYPASYGQSNSNRFTFAQWRAFYGWCGHQHVPENSHGDPGALDWPTIQRMAREIVNPPKPDPKPKPPTEKPERIRLRQYSAQFSDSPEQQAADALEGIPDADARNAPDFIGFTELGGSPTKGIIRDRCKAAGYRLYRAKGADGGIAVHPRHKITERCYNTVLEGFRSPSGSGSYRERGITTVAVTTPAGNEVTVAEAHWITDYDPKDSNDRRDAKHRTMTTAMIDAIVAGGTGSRVAFWMGDTNVDEAKDRGQDPGGIHAMFTAAGLVSVYDELDEYPATHGRKTLDVIGSYNPDKRVKAVSVRRGPRRESDHRLVDAVYEIAPRRKS